MKSFKKVIALTALVCLTAVTLQGCAGNNGSGTIPVEDNDVVFDSTASTWNAISVKNGKAEYPWSNSALDSSDMPTWTGKKLKLVLWDCENGKSPLLKYVRNSDVVWKEITRVTGVEFDVEKSYSNGTATYEGLIEKKIAGREFPDIMVGTMGYRVNDLANYGYLYDLTDAVDVYLPNLTGFFSEENNLGSVWGHPAVTDQNSSDGKIYGIPSHLGWGSSYSNVYSDTISPEVQPLIGEADPSINAYCYIRDDILKALYPNQSTVAELKEDMQEWIDGGLNGLPFEEDTVILNDITTAEDFYNLMLRMKDEIATGQYEFAAPNGNEMYVIPLSAGGNSDMHALLNCDIMSIFGVADWSSSEFTYWDVGEQRIEFGATSDWFKDVMKYWNRAYRDGLANEQDFIRTSSEVTTSMRNGEYAIVYGPSAPTTEGALVQGANFAYRKVSFGIQTDTTKFEKFDRDPAEAVSVANFYKTGIAAEDMPQVLAFYDFCLSDVGSKLAAWGPESAGLFEEGDYNELLGMKERTYKDGLLERLMTKTLQSGESTELNLDYNLAGMEGVSANIGSGAPCFPAYPTRGYNVYNGVMHYALTGRTSVNVKMYNDYINPALYHSKNLVPGKAPYISNLGACETARDIYNKKMQLDDELKRCLVSKSDTEFESDYQTAMARAAQIGMTEVNRAIIDDYFRNVYNKDFIDALIAATTH